MNERLGSECLIFLFLPSTCRPRPVIQGTAHMLVLFVCRHLRDFLPVIILTATLLPHILLLTGTAILHQGAALREKSLVGNPATGRRRLTQI